MRVAFVADTMDALGGGIVSSVRFVRALRERRHDVTVIAGGHGPLIDVRLRAFQLPVRAMRAMRFAFARPHRATLERAIAGADVVHLQFPFWLSFAALAAARRLRVPVVAAFHVQPENLLRNVGLTWRWLRDRLYRFWVRRLYDRADAVICPSSFAERRLREHGLGAPTHVISNGTRLTTPRRARRDPRWGDRFVLLSVGRLAREKRHDVLIDAVARARHRDRLQLVIAGAGPLDADLRARAAALPHPAAIGWVSDERLAELYASADLLVHAGEVELEGMAVLEAAGAGLPALIADGAESAASELAAAPELLFRAGDPADLAARLDALVDDRPRLARAASRAIDIARAHAFDRSVERLEAAYATVARLAAA
jgi:glycosyltransferase involved in cell wall biosynthesis